MAAHTATVQYRSEFFFRDEDGLRFDREIAVPFRDDFSRSSFSSIQYDLFARRKPWNFKRLIDPYKNISV
jgi:hypothetical protein